jgi:hypothetical protein
MRLAATQSHCFVFIRVAEHGTDGYQHRLPYTQVEVADLWDVNNYIKDTERRRMAAQPYWLE